ncbi:hypothetical protein AB0M05_20255 [Streptomyces violaceusniger]|uniref:hypothetical protein n=1 Tax=Streptomyces violaceusniger TaxID=68280 RepID=UPI0034197EA4
MALARAVDGIETGEGRLAHEASPLGEIMDGPQIVLGRVEPDAAQLLGAESAATDEFRDTRLSCGCDRDTPQRGNGMIPTALPWGRGL